MMGVPAGTPTVIPSMVTLTSACSGMLDRLKRRRARPAQVRIELGAEFLDAAHHRGRARVAQHADGLARHLLGQVEQEVEVARLALPGDDALEHARRPRRSFAALRALRTRLVRIELGVAPDG